MSSEVEQIDTNPSESVSVNELYKNYKTGDYVTAKTALGSSLTGEIIEICEIRGTTAMLIRDFDLAATDPIHGAMLVRGERYLLHPEKNQTLRKLTDDEVGHKKNNYNRRNDVKLAKYYESEIYNDLNKLDESCRESEDIRALTYVVTIMNHLQRVKMLTGISKEFITARDEIGQSFVDISNVLRLDTSGIYLQDKINVALGELEVLGFKSKEDTTNNARKLQIFREIRSIERIALSEA